MWQYFHLCDILGGWTLDFSSFVLIVGYCCFVIETCSQCVRGWSATYSVPELIEIWLPLSAE